MGVDKTSFGGVKKYLFPKEKNGLRVQKNSQVVFYSRIQASKLPQSVLRTASPLVVRSAPISRALRACFLGCYHMAHISQEHFDKLTCSWM